MVEVNLKVTRRENLGKNIFLTGFDKPVSITSRTGELMEAIKRDFGSFEKMKEKMSAATVAVQGSGWGWLGYSKDSGRLSIAACANQDPLQGTTGQRPKELVLPFVTLRIRPMMVSVSDP